MTATTLARGFALAAIAIACIPAPVRSGPEPTHAIAMHGEPKYGPGFLHFDYVDRHAPTGGEIRLASEGTFDSFNPFIPKGNTGIGQRYFESLLTESADEPFTEYGLIAESVQTPDDRSWVVFTLRPEARWHDGEPITVEDVIWSLETLKSKGHPFYRFYYASVASAERIGERGVKFTFTERGNRELPLIVGQLPILAKHYWEGRDFTKTTLDPPLTSGPYRVTDFEPGRFIVQERVEDWWGRDLPVNRGRYNFDRMRTDYFFDTTAVRQALKSGDVDYRAENTAKAWAQAYDVRAVRRGWLRKEEVPHERPTGMQAFAFNTRRELFSDRRVRWALVHAFDFEWTNEHLFFGQYTRTESYFSNSELASGGLPGGEELEILERYRGRVPDEVFERPYAAPSTDGTGWPRENLKKALALLEDAGWTVRDSDLKLVNARGEPFRFEFLLVSKGFERIVLPYVRNLRKLGIEVSVRLVDQSQYINRLRSFDFDMIVASWGQSSSPGNEQRDFWSSDAADSPAARNYAGVRDPVVDELVELVITAPSREALIARTRALDRVLLWGHYVVPNWHIRYDRLLWWDKFDRPEVTPRRGTSVDLWWHDEEKAARLAAQRAGETRTPGEEAGGSTPSAGVVLGVAAGLFALGWVVWRRAWR